MALRSMAEDVLLVLQTSMHSRMALFGMTGKDSSLSHVFSKSPMTSAVCSAANLKSPLQNCCIKGPSTFSLELTRSTFGVEAAPRPNNESTKYGRRDGIVYGTPPRAKALFV